MLTVTDSAAQHLQALVREQDDPAKGLRIFIEKGGCAGLQYGMTLDGVKVLVDPESAGFLAGATIDYSDDLAGAGFRIKNPNAVRSCGCGTSFETADTDSTQPQH
jgi:iron-sulfur cluster assembly accessory protein